MTSALEQQTDPLLDAVAILARAALNALGDGMLEAVYKDPRNLSTGTGYVGKLPAMSIYRVGQKRRRESSSSIVYDVRVLFDYCLTQSRIGGSPDERELRWPALAKAWEEVSETVIAGSHDTVQSGADILGTAGAWVDESRADVDVKFGFAERDNENYPFFRGQMNVVFCREAVDVAALDDFLEHFTSFDAPGGDHTEPRATDTTILPAFGS